MTTGPRRSTSGRAGLQFTFLRDNFYLDFLPLMVGRGRRHPWAGGRRPGVRAVARDDVARVAVAVLLDPERTGPDLRPHRPGVAVIDEVAVVHHSERPVATSRSTTRRSTRLRGPPGVCQAPTWQIDAWVSTYTAIASGDVEAVSDDVRRVTGEPPIDLRTLLATGSG